MRPSLDFSGPSPLYSQHELVHSVKSKMGPGPKKIESGVTRLRVRQRSMPSVDDAGWRARDGDSYVKVEEYRQKYLPRLEKER